MTVALVSMLRAIALSSVVSLAMAKSACAETITKNVVIIGGGASGAHAAVRLREDFDKSVIVIEKKSHLGGHVATYTDTSGKTYEYGVQSYLEVGEAVDFFARFNITVGVPARIPLTSVYADFSTGQNISDYVAPLAADRSAALRRFLAAAEPYESMLLPGYWDFPAPEDIPEDLLLPFGEFAQKYDLLAAMPQMFQVPGPGVPDWVDAPTLHVMQVFGAPMARALTGAAPTFTPTGEDNSELYRRITALLGEDVLFSSTVTKAERNGDGVKLTVTGADGKKTKIVGDRLLISFEPTPDAMAPFDLDEAESAVFEKFTHSKVFAGIVKHPSLPANISIVNTVPTAAPDNYLSFPEAPILARFDYMGAPSDLFRVLIVGDDTLDVDGAQKLVRDSLSALLEAGTIADGDIDDLVFAAFVDHGPMHLRAGLEDIKGGFIQEQYALQGHRSTWYTGAAWSVQFTTLLWAYNDVLLPKLLESL
ncbi:uncharacterized protein DNG_08907 [Cephalotrichum gorgonifer]|uniref:Amine oxidase domain-containing protein n=1 Tax=Cephalotrichum gorgonifer TaxID=2041049 RepID=A0AAE8N6U7_9PEZI|nr:uncharacterized protein DNG_08907 [Cephalotrichum gorgonifer]